MKSNPSLESAILHDMKILEIMEDKITNMQRKLKPGDYIAYIHDDAQVYGLIITKELDDPTLIKHYKKLGIYNSYYIDTKIYEEEEEEKKLIDDYGDNSYEDSFILAINYTMTCPKGKVESVHKSQIIYKISKNLFNKAKNKCWIIPNLKSVINTDKKSICLIQN